MNKFIIALLCGVVLLLPSNSEGIILMGTGDPSVNTNAPADDRGWKFQGKILNPGAGAGITGTVIGERHVVVTEHINVVTNAEFVLNGVTNKVIAIFHDPETELVVCKMQNSFGISSNNWAPLYENTSPIGKQCAIFGMGQRRGELLTSSIINSVPFVITNLTEKPTSLEFDVTGGSPWVRFSIQQSSNVVDWVDRSGTYNVSHRISVPKSSIPQAYFRVRAHTTVTNGWLLGNYDFVRRWGMNEIQDVSGEFMLTTFDASSTDTNECTITPYDSSGGLFIKDTDSVWKLAGINYGSFYSPWSHDGGIDVFPAALFDQTGLWYGYFPTAYYQNPLEQAVPSRSYHTAIAPRVVWIRWAMTQ